MERPRYQFTIGQAMIGVGIVAVLAVLPSWFVGLLVVVLFVPAALLWRAPSRRRLAVAGLLLAVYPVVMLAALYATWLAAWSRLGHRPRPWRDHPMFIGPLVDGFRGATSLLLGAYSPGLVVCLVVVVGRLIAQVEAGRARPAEFVPLLMALAFWVAVLPILVLDPGGVFTWFMD